MPKTEQTPSKNMEMALLTELRSLLRPYWSPMEAGGIFLLADMDDSVTIQAFSQFFKYFPEIDSGNDKTKWMELSRRITSVCFNFFQYATLEPGTYKLQNYHLSYAENNAIAFDSNGHPPIDLAPEDPFSFTLSDSHLKLMRHMNIREWNGNVELMDPKRPYGNATYYFIEMADALGDLIPLNSEGEASFDSTAEKRYLNLHREMIFAVQAFWNYAKNPVGNDQA